MSAEKDKTLFQSLSNWDDFKYWLTDHKLQALGAISQNRTFGSFFRS